jgi:beta-mannanase
MNSCERLRKHTYKEGRYQAAYKHIVDRLRETGATNFATVWQAAALGSGTYLDRPVEAWHPGDEYMDWVGTSYFSSVEPIQDKLLDFARAHGKPVMIAEAAPQG